MLVNEMKNYIILFVLGIGTAISIPFILDLINTGEVDDESLSDFIDGLKETDKVTKGIYYLLYMLLLPIAAIPVLKKKLTGRVSLLYAFIAGNGYGFAIIGLVGLLS